MGGPGPGTLDEETVRYHLSHTICETCDRIVQAAAAGRGDRAMAGARLDEARWWHYQHHEDEYCNPTNRCIWCKRIADLERRSAIERTQTPQSREAVVDSPREARNENETT